MCVRNSCVHGKTGWDIFSELRIAHGFRFCFSSSLLCRFAGYMQRIAAILLILLGLRGHAQVVSVDYLMGDKQQLIDVYKPDKSVPNIVLKMKFADDSILNPQVIRALKGKAVSEIHLVYSEYRQVSNFDQPELNRTRLENLKKIAPEIFNSTTIKWKFIAQTGCRNPEQCEKYFHGFVIFFQLPTTKETAKKDAEFLDKNFKLEPVDTIEEVKKKRVVVDHYYVPKAKWKQRKGITYKTPGIWNRKRKNVYDTLLVHNKRVIYDYPFKYYMTNKKYFTDSTIFKVFERNPKWNKMLLVTDITGSMTQYILQILAWTSVDSNLKRVRTMVVFNDGDNKPDMAKQMGSTGGIYFISPTSAEYVFKEIRKDMNKGNGGGDIPENDMEALIAGFQYCKDCSEAFLIADNTSDCRDFPLLWKIKKPVHIILCGTGDGVNIQYLEMARRTGGSVHTIEQDITDLQRLNEGDTFTIGKQKFMLKDEKFVLTR